MPDFSAKAGDTAPTWSDTLTYSNGNAANLTGASVQLVVRSWNSPAPLFNSAATIVAPLLGTVSYTPTAANTALPGNYVGSWVVTFPGGVVQTWPTTGYLDIVIEPSASATGIATIVSLEEVKEHLNIPSSDRQHDAKLLGWIYGLIPVVENIVGPVVPQTYNEWRDGGQYDLIPFHHPIVQLLACSIYIGPVEYDMTIVGNPAAGTLYSVMVDPDPPYGRRIVRRGPGGGLIPFPSGLQSVHLIYQAGRATIPENIKLGTKELIKLNYQPSQQGNLRTFGGGGGGGDTAEEITATVPVGFAVPGRVRELLLPDRRYPSIA